MRKKKLIGWEMPGNRDKFESLDSAKERLCGTCLSRKYEIIKYGIRDGEKDLTHMFCGHGFDPRCVDGSDCPYYKPDELAVAELVMKRIEASVS